MSLLLSLCLTAALAFRPPAAPVPPPPPMPPAFAPLAVTQVLREGLPPYENDSSRLYRLEGEGCDKLAEGQVLLLARGQERRLMGRLEVTRVTPHYALARLVFAGETFPLRGDRAYPRGSLKALPLLPPPLKPWTVSAQAALGVPATRLAPPGPETGFQGQREPLYFLPEESRISEAGQLKLQAWVKAWGRDRRWSLGCPTAPGESLDLCAGRIATLTEELRRLGVAQVEVVILPDETPGPYPVIYIVADPW